MKIRPVLFGLLMLASIAPVSLGAAEVAASPLAPIAFLAGAVWRAELPPAPDGTKKGIELRAEFAANHQALRVDSAWLQGEKTVPYTSGMYAWNAAKQKLVIWYTDASGVLTEGVITQEGDTLLHELSVIGKDGKSTEVRCRITPVGMDAYTSEISVAKNGAWEKIVELRYVKVPPTAAAGGK